MSEPDKIIACNSCGAPVVSEICPYCHKATGYSASEINNDFEIIECKEAHLDKQRAFSSVLFGVGFFIFAILLIHIKKYNLAIDASNNIGNTIANIFIFVIFIIGISFLILLIIRFLRLSTLKSKGIKLTGIVIGYCNDNFMVNGYHLQVAKILVKTTTKNYILLYQLGTASQPFGINTTVHVIYHSGLALIKEDMPDFI